MALVTRADAIAQKLNSPLIFVQNPRQWLYQQRLYGLCVDLGREQGRSHRQIVNANQRRRVRYS